MFKKRYRLTLNNPLKLPGLLNSFFLMERTVLRRFVKATGQKSGEYLQGLRIQKACEYFENSQHII